MEQLQFPELVNIKTVAKLLRVDERYVRRMVAEDVVPIVKIGHYVRFDIEDFRRFVEAHRRPRGEQRSRRRGSAGLPMAEP